MDESVRKLLVRADSYLSLMIYRTNTNKDPDVVREVNQLIGEIRRLTG